MRRPFSRTWAPVLTYGGARSHIPGRPFSRTGMAGRRLRACGMRGASSAPVRSAGRSPAVDRGVRGAGRQAQRGDPIRCQGWRLSGAGSDRPTGPIGPPYPLTRSVRSGCGPVAGRLPNGPCAAGGLERAADVESAAEQGLRSPARRRGRWVRRRYGGASPRALLGLLETVRRVRCDPGCRPVANPLFITVVRWTFHGRSLMETRQPACH